MVGRTSPEHPTAEEIEAQDDGSAKHITSLEDTDPPAPRRHRIITGIQPARESGRRGINLYQFFRICWRSTNRASRLCNILWPVVPAAIAVMYARRDLHIAIFTLNYLAMIPCANLIGFAGQELGRKLHKVYGVLLETTLGSAVEIVMTMVLVNHDQFEVIKAAILGSVLATQLLCLGLRFLVGGACHKELEFSEAVGEVGSDLLLTAGFALIVPAAFYTAVSNNSSITNVDLAGRVLHLSRITTIFLVLAYAVYIYFQMGTHRSIYDAIFEVDEIKDHESQEVNPKLTFIECIIALTVAISLVAIITINLVNEIPSIVMDCDVSDSFVGLILIPLVEKSAEHLC